MKTTLLLLLLFTTILSANERIKINSKNMGQFEITIDNQTFANYGGKYPLTYKFQFTSGSNIKVYKSGSANSEQIKLDEKTKYDFFNAIEAVRFDYDNGFAYVSVGFTDNDNSINLKFEDDNGLIETEFIEVCKYYDNRKAVVTASIDDYASWFKDWAYESVKAFQQNKIWITMGVITDGSYSNYTWESIQELLDSGYCEAASHSRQHLHIQQYDYEYEIIGSKLDIIEELDLPGLFKNGDKEYVYTWIAPYGEHDETSDKMYGEANYLVNRTYDDGEYGIAEWDTVNNTYKAFGVTGEIGITSWPSSAIDDTVALAQRFDIAYEQGGVYHVVLHPQSINWGKRYSWAHLEYVGGRNDVWYTSLGHLYLYQYLMNKNSVITEIEDKDELPATFTLEQNYPNPFNPSTIINYSLAQNDFITIKIYNALGEEIKTLVSEEQIAGEHSVVFEGKDIASGTYFYRLTGSNSTQSRKMILVK